MKIAKRLAKQRIRRGFRVRNRARKSSTSRLRLSVHRTNKNISAQLIDDEAGRTLVSASTMESSVCAAGESGGNKAAAAKVGKALAERAKEKGITEVAFDRGPFRYHGRVLVLADAAREGGLQF